METIVAADSTFSGVLEAEHVTIAGQFEGELRASGRVRVTESGRVKGKLAAADIEIGGWFSGELESLRLVFSRSAKAEGRFVAERLRIDEGADVQGAFNETGEEGGEDEERGLSLVEPTPQLPALSAA
jgi:cytoskeletal protein CcmA (bactofilin family)